MKISSLFALITGAGLLAAAPAFGMSASASDATFVKKAAQGGMAEVRLAHLALQKSSTPAVVSFAKHMLADHTQANAQLKSIAVAGGYSLPAGVGPMNAALMAQLQAAHGSTFDAQYLKSQLPAHQKMLRLMQTEAASGQDTKLVAFAKATVPVVEHHIMLDRRDLASIGASVGMR